MNSYGVDDEVELTNPEEVPFLLERLLVLASLTSEINSGLGVEIHAVYAGLREALRIELS